MCGDDMDPAERIRSRDRLIIERGGVYLAGARNGQPLWHWSKYHAWWDENHNGRYVEKVAAKVGGTVMLFNPITGNARKKERNDD